MGTAGWWLRVACELPDHPGLALLCLSPWALLGLLLGLAKVIVDGLLQ